MVGVLISPSSSSAGLTSREVHPAGGGTLESCRRVDD